MAVINTGLLVKGLRSTFFQRYAEIAALSWYQRVTMRVQSDNASETYKWLGQVPQMREWGTGRVAKGFGTNALTVAAQKHEATLEVDRDEISDDQTGQIRLRIDDLAVRAATHKDRLVSNLLINGETAGYTAYDGAVYFATTHSEGASGNQSNLYTVDISGIGNDLPNSPDTVAFKYAFREGVRQMMSILDDQAQPMAWSDQGMIVICPPTMRFAAIEALQALIVSNTTNVVTTIADIIATPYLTTANEFYLVKTDSAIKPFIDQDREPVEFGSLTEDSEEGFMKEKFYFGVRARYTEAYGDWHKCAKVKLTT